MFSAVFVSSSDCMLRACRLALLGLCLLVGCGCVPSGLGYVVSDPGFVLVVSWWIMFASLFNTVASNCFLVVFLFL